ncbi:restriction endonuclease subunit S [Litorilituus sediminis]|uniref:Restriction endonuclease subunit S n=1 Tax=Litorilituus sediminis TaxID=718192 RepID=A0A4P6P4S0_9GAMM|nr:restriction endonuclease subunit S [Litorilituus sediminis]QBG35089.1 restriction endonuclease subunit S [Litorilituus sediminis]
MDNLKPKLRFKQFSKPYIQKKLGDVTAFKNGKGHEQFVVPTGKYEIVNSKFISSGGEVKKYSEEQICPVFSGDILMVMSDVPKGKALAKTYLVKANDKYTLNQRICSLTPYNDYPVYLNYLINRNTYFLRFDSGVSQTNLRKEEVLNCPLVISNEIEEQKKIAAFLFTIDNRISLLKEKHNLLSQYKEGVMQKLFKQEIRFKDENGDSFTSWQEFKVSDVLNLVLNPLKMKDESDYELITVRRRNGGVDSRGIYKGKEVLVKTQFELKKNQFVISKRQIVHGACGIVPDELEGAIVSNEYNVFEPVSSLLDIKFFNLFSQTKYMKRSYFINSDGVHIEKLLFKTQSWLKTKVSIPSVEEQQKIVGFIESIDKKLQAINEQIEHTETLKKGLLQQMFV